jgi:four helix bundle protein
MKNEETWTISEVEKPYNIRHRCFHFSREIIFFIEKTKYDRIHFSIFDQLLRSATSIGANMVEGASGSSNKDFINFMYISLKSVNETKYWLCLIRETVAVNRDKVNELLSEADELSKIIGRIILMQKSRRAGILNF